MNSHLFSNFVCAYLLLTIFQFSFKNMSLSFKFITVVLICQVWQKVAVHQLIDNGTSWETSTPVERHRHQLRDIDISWDTMTSVEKLWHQFRDIDTSWKRLTRERFWDQLRDSDTGWETMTSVVRLWHQFRETPFERDWHLRDSDTSRENLTPVERIWYQLRDADTSRETLTCERLWHQLRDSDTSWETLTPVERHWPNKINTMWQKYLFKYLKSWNFKKKCLA